MLLLHGFTGQRTESGFLFVRLARAMNRRGMAAVTFDFLHSGESDGSFEKMLPGGELADALRMTEWLVSQPFVDRTRLGLLGFSLGGLVAACLCGRTAAYRALVLLAPTTVDNLCRLAETAASEPTTYGAHALHPDFFNDLRGLDPLGDVVRHPRPTLLVQGSADTAVTPTVSAEYVKAMQTARIDVDAHQIPDADHAFGQPAAQKNVLELAGDWAAAKLC